MLAEIAPHLLNGLALGLLFALIALGFMLIVGLMETINLAHGSFFALGAYMALFLISPPFEGAAFYAGWPIGLRYVLALLVAPLAVGAVGMVLELALRRTYGKDPLYGLLLTFGAALVLEEAIRMAWGSRERVLPLPVPLEGPVVIGEMFFAKYRFYAAGAAAVAIGLLWLFIEKTGYGAKIKAGSYDSEMIRALGVNLAKLRLWVFALGVALAAVAGIVLAPIWGIRPQVGVDAVVPAFLIIVLGGVGSFWGAVSAGLLVGMVVGLTGAFLSDWAVVSMYLLFIAVVTVRARGLAGRKSLLDV
jgi:branched-subunit amino acid ABC-type transport system permease component